MSTMRKAVLTLLLAAASLAAAAEPRYAVLSLLSDRLTIITRDMATGSHIDRNRRESLPIPGNLLDKNMVLALDDALRASGAKSGAVLLFTSDPRIFARQAQLLDEKDGTAQLLDAVRPVLKGVDATHLVLATKYRHDARLEVDDGYVGDGSLDGLGFYIDRTYEPRRTGTIGITPGYLAAFAYFKLALIDLATGRVVREVPVFASESRWGTLGETGDPWDSMSSEDKAAALARLLNAQAPQAMAKLLAS
jgi:hypothetical protein